MFIKGKSVYLYLMSCIDNATTEEERQRYEDLLQLYLADCNLQEMYIEDDYIDEFDDNCRDDFTDYFTEL